MSNHDDHRTRVLPAGLKPVAAARGNMSSFIEIFADSNDVKFTSFTLRKSKSARRYRYWVSHWVRAGRHWVSLGPRASCILKVREDI